MCAEKLARLRLRVRPANLWDMQTCYAGVLIAKPFKGRKRRRDRYERLHVWQSSVLLHLSITAKSLERLNFSFNCKNPHLLTIHRPQRKRRKKTTSGCGATSPSRTRCAAPPPPRRRRSSPRTCCSCGCCAAYLCTVWIGSSFGRCCERTKPPGRRWPGSSWLQPWRRRWRRLAKRTRTCTRCACISPPVGGRQRSVPVLARRQAARCWLLPSHAAHSTR